jgi:hypothetical protein
VERFELKYSVEVFFSKYTGGGCIFRQFQTNIFFCTGGRLEIIVFYTVQDVKFYLHWWRWKMTILHGRSTVFSKHHQMILLNLKVGKDFVTH